MKTTKLKKSIKKLNIIFLLLLLSPLPTHPQILKKKRHDIILGDISRKELLITKGTVFLFTNYETSLKVFHLDIEDPNYSTNNYQETIISPNEFKRVIKIKNQNSIDLAILFGNRVIKLYEFDKTTGNFNVMGTCDLHTDMPDSNSNNLEILQISYTMLLVIDNNLKIYFTYDFSNFSVYKGKLDLRFKDEIGNIVESMGKIVNQVSIFETSGECGMAVSIKDPRNEANRFVCFYLSSSTSEIGRAHV